MRHLIGCQVALLKIKRSLDLRPTFKDVGETAECLAGMVGYLRALQHEFTHNYSVVADCQRYDAAVSHRRLEELTTTGAPFDPSLAASHDAWNLLNDVARFPLLDDFTRCGPKYSARFRRPLNEVAALLLQVPKPHVDAAGFDRRVEELLLTRSIGCAGADLVAAERRCAVGCQPVARRRARVSGPRRRRR
jgi:hypothetical protein